MTDKIKTGREHHLTFWDDSYREQQYKYAKLFMLAETLLKDLEDLERVCKNIDANRRENAVHFGVPILESDKHYSFEAVIKGVPVLVKTLKEQYAKQGLDIRGEQ